MHNQINITTYYGDAINTKVNNICREFVTSTSKDINKIVADFDEDDPNCFRLGEHWFDKHKLRQLLNYLKLLNLTTFNIIHVYTVLDGRYCYCPNDTKKNLVIRVETPIKRSGFWLEPECHTPSGGNYIYTRADIKLT